MKIATTNKESIKKLKGHDITYFFSDDYNIDELIEISKLCDVKRLENNNILFDVAIDTIQVLAKKYCSSEDLSKIDEEVVFKEHKIAVIIPNYNYGEWLDKSIISVVNQTYQNTEIIFVDDVSTDNSVEIAKKLLRPQDKLIVLKQKRLNGGARNEAYLHLSDNVDYIMYLDSDDWLIDNGVIDRINKSLNDNGFPDVLALGIQKIKNGKSIYKWIPKYEDKYDYMENGLTGSCTKVIKKELATRKECLYNEGTLMEDKNHHMKIAYYMNTFANFPEITHIWNKDNTKSVSTARDNAKWGTCPYRNYADCLQFILEVKDKDIKADLIMEKRLENIKYNMEKGSDHQK